MVDHMIVIKIFGQIILAMNMIIAVLESAFDNIGSGIANLDCRAVVRTTMRPAARLDPGEISVL
jgi:hypothetical protein